MDISAIAGDALEMGSLVISHFAVLSFIFGLNSFWLVQSKCSILWRFWVCGHLDGAKVVSLS